MKPRRVLIDDHNNTSWEQVFDGGVYKLDSAIKITETTKTGWIDNAKVFSITQVIGKLLPKLRLK